MIGRISPNVAALIRTHGSNSHFTFLYLLLRWNNIIVLSYMNCDGCWKARSFTNMGTAQKKFSATAFFWANILSFKLKYGGLTTTAKRLISSMIERPLFVTLTKEHSNTHIALISRFPLTMSGNTTPHASQEFVDAQIISAFCHDYKRIQTSLLFPGSAGEYLYSQQYDKSTICSLNPSLYFLVA